MAETSHIEWTDATWNPVTGCTMVSAGCTHCYAMQLAGTRLKDHPSRKGLTRESAGRPVWAGEVRFNREWLTQPLTWRRPRRIFVCAHGDLFHESVPVVWIDQVFAVMALCPHHQFQVLTKRPERMREYVTEHGDGSGRTISVLERVADAAARMVEDGDNAGDTVLGGPWPLPHVWLGTSIEDQATADERVPHLLATPAAVRFVSAEPLLGPVDLRWIAEPDDEKDGVIDALLGCNWIEQSVTKPDFHPCRPGHEGRALGRFVTSSVEDILDGHKLHWVIVGGESGPGARPMHPDWARAIRDQCAEAGAPFFFKQWGEWAPIRSVVEHDAEEGGCREYLVTPGDEPLPVSHDAGIRRALTSRDGAQAYARLGKARAGRLLDGVQHDAMPGGGP